ncbi:MAG: PilZ domain-containing protein, partial [Myxococcota bacterium]
MEMIDLPGRDAKREPEGWDDAGYMAFLMRAKERRRWKRVEADCGVTIIMGGITVQGRAVDISGNGVSVKTDAEVWPGVRMRLKMRLLNAEDAVET